MRITARIYRFDPVCDTAPRYETFTVDVEHGARVLHFLHAVHERDPGLSYRYCCGTGQCGSCAVRMDGIPVLACMEEVRDGITIDPLNLPVKKDLVVDMQPALERLAGIISGGEDHLLDRDTVETIKPLRGCIECLACVSVCPAMEVARFAGPTAMRQEMRRALDPRDNSDRITEAIRDGLFTCTTCQNCWKVCPKKIEIPAKAIEKLRAIANRMGLSLPRHREVEQLIRDTGRSIPRGKSSFLEQVPEVIEPEGKVRKTVGFFVGCMYDFRLPDAALDAIEVLRRNGIRVIIPHEQVCCGSPLIRTGQLQYLDNLQRRNIQAFTSRGIDTVVTMCAGCGSTLKKDYCTPFTVKDITEILTELGIEEPACLPLRITYHDPCHALHGQGIQEPARILLNNVVDIIEIPQKCCGAGGGTRSGCPDISSALGKRRAEELVTTGADVIVSCCPFCEYQLGEFADRSVKNITTILHEGYREKDRLARVHNR
ncbi:MAG: succinate dehydrogenase/fumarate reductase iron-sulfur subunit [Methanomicrobiales archaeon]|nr:succinate dehydrogenase/fumarate reductase iron-sulfur subunit [Methanomicrobiales archaeon]